ILFGMKRSEGKLLLDAHGPNSSRFGISQPTPTLRLGGNMKSKALARLTGIGLFIVLASPVSFGAQERTANEHPTSVVRYRFIDLGTFGGPNSFTNGSSVVINESGTVVGAADTDIPCPYFPDFLISPAFKWKKGVMTPLPRLPGGCGGFPIAI